MNDVKLLNRILWGFNFLLGALIVAFSFRYLLLPPAANYLKDFKQEDDAPSPVTRADPGDGALKTLPNPLEKRSVAGPVKEAGLFKATLKGTMPSGKDPKVGVAFIKAMGRNVDIVAYIGDEIFYDGKPFDEFRGWTLTSVSKDRALFTSKSGQKEELTIDLAVTPAPGTTGASGSAPAARTTARVGTAYTTDTYKSRLLASADSRQVWGMDQDEIEWAAQNAEQIMDRDFQVAPYAGGGLRLENVNAGSIGAARGLLAGDVLREVNGQPLNNIADVRTLLNNKAMQQQTGLRLTIERAGKPVVIEYRPLPK
ncbi:MAG: PDZ domain-containing protein [Planctomycetes bacterium]|nr:PDZ domain-containing protein [Planctomycetota bacterium]